MGKRDKRVEDVHKGMIIQELSNLNWKSIEERTEGSDRLEG